MYLAVVTDVFSRKVVGWAFGVRMTAELVTQALDMALMTRKPSAEGKGVGDAYADLGFCHNACG